MAKKTTTGQIDKQGIARTLFLEGNYTQEEIAEKVGVTRQTIIRWANVGKWQELKASLSITPAQIISQWQQQVVGINDDILKREEGKRHPTPAEADALFKIAKLIKMLQQDLGISEIISSCMRFLLWLRPLDMEQAKTFNNLMNLFIKEQINTPTKR